jgi:hypothetical protein
LRNLILSSLVVLLLSACSPLLFNNYKRPEAGTDNGGNIPSWFREAGNRYLFQASIDIYKKHFSGLLFIKRLSADSSRILYITELGMKIFDLEFPGNGSSRVIYCMEGLNKKSVLSLLQRDMGLMIRNITIDNKAKILESRKDSRKIIKIKEQKGTSYCFLNDSTGTVDELIHTGLLAKKLHLRYFSSNGMDLDSIALSHYSVKLNIHLSKLNER